MADVEKMNVEEKVHSDDEMDVSKDPKAPEDISKDGGVLKEIIKEGSGWEKPENGSDVKVHYVGRLQDGSVFDSSRDRGQEFEFVLGRGQVIKGWDLGVASMKKGELSRFTLKPDYAYGKAGSPPKIPADATLIFEVELLSFSNEKDITKKRDGGILKKTLQEGQGWQQPNYEAKCVINYVTRLADGTEVENVKEKHIVIGDEHVVAGLEQAVESMKAQEKALFKVHSRYAYGTTGNAALKIGPDAQLTYEVELVSFEKEKESWELDKFEDKYEAALARKAAGNQLYKDKHLQRAVKKYNKALEFFQYDSKLEAAQKERVNKELKVPCYLNLAACHLTLHEYKKVLENANKALEVDGHNVKGLYRRGVANTELDQWDQARQDLDKALSLDPNSADIKTAIARLNHKVKAQDAKDRKVFGNLFQKLSALEDKEKPASVKSETKTDEVKE
jgi:FK506-binding protein 4/5